MLPVQFNCSLDTVVLNKDIPKTVVPHQKTLSLFTLSPPPPPKTDTSAVPTKCTLSRLNLHHPVLKLLGCVDLSDSLVYCSYLVQFSSSINLFTLYTGLLQVRSSSDQFCHLSKHQRVGKVHCRRKNNNPKIKEKKDDNHCSIHPSIQHQSVSPLFVLLPCLPPVEVTAVPLQAPVDTRIWSGCSSSVSGSSSWICRRRAMARSIVAVLTRLKSCMLTRCRRKLRQRLRRIMWAPRFSAKSMMA